MSDWPSVGVVLPTRNRPRLLRAALAAVFAQDYPGPLHAVVVYDGSEPDRDLSSDHGTRRVRVLGNERCEGLAGARNTGLLALGTDLVAFCDDDDEWLPGKLRAQVQALRDRPGAEFASCGIVVDCDGRSTPRLAGRDEVTYADLLRSRMMMVHSSTYLGWREALIDGIGLLDETIPGGQNEDWDLVLRAARRQPIVCVDRPLVRVRWSPASYFSLQWETKIQSFEWMLDHHPDLATCRVGAARVYAQLAFACASAGRRADAWRWAGRALRRNWHERRVPFALAVAAGLVSGDAVLHRLNARGHGI